MNDGGSAYPIVRNWVTDTQQGGRDYSGVTDTDGGLTIRDWFAGRSLAGIRSMKSGSELSSLEALDLAYNDADAAIERRKGQNE